MTRRSLLLLALFGLVTALIVAVFQSSPGYMDADYYFAGGYRLATGGGFTEPFLWNYLNDPVGLPAPSHTYWMPLASLVAALGIWLFGGDPTIPVHVFVSGRLGFLLVAALIPPLTASLAFSISHKRDASILAGLLACFSAFYLPYLPTTDTFGIYMASGALWLWIAGCNQPPVRDMGVGRLMNMAYQLQPLGLGLIAGFMHLARADGLIWLALAFTAILCQQTTVYGHVSRIWVYVNRLLLCCIAYLIILAPWFYRNFTLFGTPLAPGGGRALWFTNYDELYTYPASMLTAAHWWASGLSDILRVRGWALGLNLQTLLFVQGEIFLLPLIILGLWRLRENRRVQLGMFAWGLTMFAMTVAFPFAGARGGFFHSGAALQPLFWAVVPTGLDVFIEWGARRRGWQPTGARTIFGGGLIILALLLTLLIVPRRVLGADWRSPDWNQSTLAYSQYDRELSDFGADPADVVLVNNPPGYYVASGRTSLAIPYGDENTLITVARRYHARFVILEANYLGGPLGELFAHPTNAMGLRVLRTTDQGTLFEVIR